MIQQNDQIDYNNVVIDINKLAAGLYYLTVSGPGVDQKIKVQKL